MRRHPDSARALSLGAALALGLALPCLAVPAGAAQPPSSPAEAEARRFVQNTIDTVLGILHDDKLSLAQKKDEVENLAYERFDFHLISRLVLARNWATMTPQQRTEFVAAFKKHLSATYRDTLDNFKDEKIAVEGSRLEPRGDVTVMTVVHGTTGDTNVDYRLRKIDGQWRGIDVIVEGVSLVQNFRSQAQEIISSEGVDALIEKLRNKQLEAAPGTKKG
jgi:phospholipid transport system substrate-binding protein